MPISPPSLLKKLQTPTSTSQILDALSHLSAPFSENERNALQTTYHWLARIAQKHDIDGRIRAQILRLLDSAAEPKLLDEALVTYGFSYGHQEVAGGLRAAALVLLDAQGSEDALWHATRLLHDPYTSAMSGEPAITAVHVLERNHAWLPLYGLLVSAPSGHLSDVVAEAIRACVSLEAPHFRTIGDRYVSTSESACLMAVIDAILAREDRDDFLGNMQTSLQQAEDLALWHFIVASCLATPSARYHEWLASLVDMPLHPEHAVVLREVFASRDTEPLFVIALRKLDRL